jgi:hypothetical protein
VSQQKWGHMQRMKWADSSERLTHARPCEKANVHTYTHTCEKPEMKSVGLVVLIFKPSKLSLSKVKRCIEAAFLVESRERECHCIALVVERFAVPESDLPERKLRRACK